jgi:hypothetical protein
MTPSAVESETCGRQYVSPALRTFIHLFNSLSENRISIQLQLINIQRFLMIGENAFLSPSVHVWTRVMPGVSHSYQHQLPPKSSIHEWYQVDEMAR